MVNKFCPFFGFLPFWRIWRHSEVTRKLMVLTLADMDRGNHQDLYIPKILHHGTLIRKSTWGFNNPHPCKICYPQKMVKIRVKNIVIQWKKKKKRWNQPMKKLKSINKNNLHSVWNTNFDTFFRPRPIYLTLKWPRYHFPTEIFAMKCAPYMYALLETIIPGKNLKCCTVSKWCNILSFSPELCYTISKWRPNNRFLFRVVSILAKIWKTT